MKIKEFFLKFIFSIALILLSIILVYIVIDIVKSVKYGIGYVSQFGDTITVKEFKKEYNGCIYYIDVYDRENKTCGNYRVETNKN